MLELPPLGLYVHIPWCVRKCPYCDFNSHERPGAGIPESAYVAALCAEIDRASPESPPQAVHGARETDPANSPDRGGVGRRLRSAASRAAQNSIDEKGNSGPRSSFVETVFFGGGTPSLFRPESFARILAELRERQCLAPDAEITLEANPGAAEAERFAGYRAAGVNRLSIGAQSFSDSALTRLGRIHDGAEARAAVAMAREAGFDNINLDLMFGLPRQSQSEALRDLETAIGLEPEHISWYQLTLEPNTVFWRWPPPLPRDDAVDAMQDAGIARLESAGYGRYEISAFARPGRECRHNLNYWRFGDYLGIGAGAHGKLSLPDTGQILRSRRARRPDRYLATGGELSTKEVKPGERPLEFLMNALRLREGFTPACFESHTGVAFGAIGEKLKCLAHQGLLEFGAGSVRASSRGYRLLDSILGEFT